VTLPVRTGRDWAWRVFLTCWLLYSFFWTPYLVREHFPALALVESGSLNVERYLGWSDDIFRGPSGRAYINNNPGASLTAAVPLYLFRPLLRRVENWNRQLPRPPLHNDGDLFWRTYREGLAFYFLLVEFLTVAAVMAPLTAATAAYLCARLVEAGFTPRHSAIIALLYGLATPVFYRAAYLNHNLLVCNAGLAALLLLWDPEGRPLSLVRVILAGLLGGYAILCDYSGGVVVITLALYVWLRSAGQPVMRRWQRMAACAGGVVPGVVTLLVYQAWAFGAVYLPSQHFMPPTAPTVHGYRGFDWPSPTLAWANFFDPRFGIFAYCPALLLAFAAPFLHRVRYRMPRREMWLLAVYFVLFVLFCAANQYSWLQPLTGFRYLVPIVPALTLLAIQAAQALPRLVQWGVAAASCIQSLVLAAAHRTDVRDASRTIWQRQGELLWMMRLRDAGTPIGRASVLAAFSLLILACASILLMPGIQKAPGLPAPPRRVGLGP
jgi:hypothetical protein